MDIKISRDKLILAAGQSVKERNYWLNKLAGELVKSHFPYDYRIKQPDQKKNVIESVKSVKYRFPGPLYAKVMKLSGGIDVKLHMILVTGMFILLNKYTGHNDIMIGSPIYKQEFAGEFINTVLVFRKEIEAHMSFKELLLGVRNTIIEADENQNYPLEILPEELNVAVKGDEFPLFDTVLLLENLHDKSYLQGIVYNMLFSFSQSADAINGIVEYNSRLFRENTVKHIVDHYLHILDQVLSDINLPMYGIGPLSDQEKQQLLCDFNNEETDYPKETCLQRLFEEQAERTPDSIAIIGKSRASNIFTSLTYGDLNTRADQLAEVLREKGVEPDTIVALMVEPSIEMMIGILGILKSGGAYLPIDLDSPRERIDYILKDSGVKILLTANEIDSLSTKCVSNSHQSSVISHQSNQLAYIIYTSGTTGKPKGVMVEHRNVVAYVHAFLRQFNIDSTDAVIQLASYCFDVFVEEVYPVLSKGGRLVVPGRAEIVEIECLSRLIAEYHVTMVDCTPLLLNEFDKLHADTGGAALKSVRTFISGGDVLKPGYVEHLLKTGSVYNTYGPTESTVCATYYHYTGALGDLTSIPIGKPISNYKIYILDEQQSPVPIGVAGELYISGSGVARGYLNRPELTAEKFNRSNLSNKTYIFYKTGDLARWLVDGNIEYLGRIDFQVKIRGYRIELGEIEAQLERYEPVEKAVVIDRQEANEDGEKYLCAYIVSRESLDFSTLRNYLSQSLPDYMIPAFFMQMDQIPVTTNGKVDRKALPAVTITADKTYVAPANKIEETLVAIWAEILNLKKEAISVNHNFFELGGHSLKATVLASRIHKELDIKLPVLEIFRHQTIKQLSAYISGVKPAEDRFAAIEPSEKKEYYVLSSAQRRLYFIFQLEERSTTYNMPDMMPVKEGIDTERLEQTFKYLIRRHESFRTSFHLIDLEPVQRIHDKVEFKIENLGVRDEETMMNFIRPFDLSCAPLLRVGLVKTRAGNYLLLLDIHHIIMDAVSIDILKEEFARLYAGEPGPLPVLNLQYKDYSEWQQHERKSGAFKNPETFWLEVLAGELPVLRLPMDFPRPLVQRFEGNSVDFQLAGKIVQQLKALVIESGSTLYIVFLTLFNLLLFKLSGQEDIIVGTVMAARRHADLQDIIGMFVNTLAMRNFPCAEKSFREFLAEVKQSTLAVYENQDYPFEDLVEKVDIVRDTSRNPIFDVVFLMQDSIEQGNLAEYAPFGYESQAAKFDMTLGGAEDGENLSFSLNYCTRLFKEETVVRVIAYFKNIVASVLLKPSQRISEIEILAEEEKQQLLVEFNHTAYPYPGDRSICELFATQVEKSPDHSALVGTTRRGSHALTYRELNEKSNHLAWILQEKGVCPDTIVGIMVERSLEIITGILGILKAGGAYLPIDPSYPGERIEYMLKDSGTQIIVGNKHACSMELNSQLSIINCELLMTDPAASFHPSSFIIHHSNHLAYIIYTSGTTGRPRGTGVYRRGLVNLIHWFVTEFGLNDKDRNLLLTSLSFDLTQKNIIAPLVTGGILTLPAPGYFDPPGILHIIEQKQLTWLNCTPAMIYKIIEYGSEEDLKQLASLRYVFLGGEPILMKGLAKWITSGYFNARIVNTYGPTECTDISACFSTAEPGRFYEKNVPTGKPIDNVELYVLDRWFRLLPVGVPGELFIAGEGVGAGYLNRPELTYERFIVEKALEVRSGPRFYKTGDLTCWLADGNIEFLGRIDQQVKIRGFRIELGEIEAQLLRNDSLNEVVVTDRAGQNGEKYLCAYIVMAKGLPLDSAVLKQYLASRLPDYMIPSYFIPLERIPLTANGKVDRGALPEPSIIPGEDYEAPGNEIEEKVANIWSEVLGVEKSKISTSANFFDIGGHSLKVMIMIAKIHQVLNFKLELIQVYKAPTIRSIASLIEVCYWVNEPDGGSKTNVMPESEEIIL